MKINIKPRDMDNPYFRIPFAYYECELFTPQEREVLGFLANCKESFNPTIETVAKRLFMPINTVKNIMTRKSSNLVKLGILTRKKKGGEIYIDDSIIYQVIDQKINTLLDEINKIAQVSLKHFDVITKCFRHTCSTCSSVSQTPLLDHIIIRSIIYKNKKKEEDSIFFANESELTEQGSDRPSEPIQETNQQNQVNNEQQVEAKSITPLSLTNKEVVIDAEESFPPNSDKQLSFQKNIEARVRVESSRNTVIDPMKARMEANRKAAMLSKSKTQYYDGELKAILEYGLKESELDAFCRWYHRNITQNNSSYRQDTYEFQTTRKRAFKGKYSNDDLVDLQGNISRYLAHKEVKEKRSAPGVDVIVENPVVDLDKVKSVLDKYRKNTDVRLSQNG